MSQMCDTSSLPAGLSTCPAQEASPGKWVTGPFQTKKERAMSRNLHPRRREGVPEVNSSMEVEIPEHKKLCKEDIRRRACEIYFARAALGLVGDELSDWLQAEHELAARCNGGHPLAHP